MDLPTRSVGDIRTCVDIHKYLSGHTTRQFGENVFGERRGSRCTVQDPIDEMGLQKLKISLFEVF